MQRLLSKLKRLAARYWREALVLPVIITLDRMGWLPDLIPDAQVKATQLGDSAAIKGISLLVSLTVAWALFDQWASRDKHKKENLGSESERAE